MKTIATLRGKKEMIILDEVWDELPMYIGYKEIMKLGFSQATIYRWFNAKDFPPMIRKGGMRVNKLKFKNWLEKNEEVCHEY